MDSGMICQPSNVNPTATPEVLNSSYWQVAPAGPPASSSFAPVGGGPTWEHSYQGRSTSTSNYGHYTLGVHTGAIPQTVFEPGDALRNLHPKAATDNGLADYTDTDSNLYTSSGSFSSAGTSDMLEAMVISDEPNHPSWTVSPSETQTQYDSLACVGAAGPGQHHTDDNPWVPPPTAVEEETVSPKMLRIRPTPTPTSSSESIRTSFLAGSADDNPRFLCPDAGALPGLKSVGPSYAVPNTRRLLPDRGQRQILPFHDSARTLPSNMPAYTSASRLDPPSPSPRKLGKLKPKPKAGLAPLQPTVASRTLASSRLPELPALAGCEGAPLTRDEIDMDDRMSKDDFLVKHKQMGMTYKEIRRIGGFTEAESTLRGRYRTLTKSREARVRKPEWSEKDLRLLEKGVRELAHSADLKTTKIPWKKVAEYIVNNGGSYHFGNSTCRKRWDELVREQAALGKAVWQPFYPQSPDQGQYVGESAGGAGYLRRSLGGYGKGM
ncbi:Myb-like domain-containing protein [Madurella fahalii]|uniref:Myb-like domain-containing protein n=1 Tax=Madurella fahalii TaxID=1157608 RepID=A0ABQ0GQI3_9PEZI